MMSNLEQCPLRTASKGLRRAFQQAGGRRQQARQAGSGAEHVPMQSKRSVLTQSNKSSISAAAGEPSTGMSGSMLRGGQTALVGPLCRFSHDCLRRSRPRPLRGLCQLESSRGVYTTALYHTTRRAAKRHQESGKTWQPIAYVSRNGGL